MKNNIILKRTIIGLFFCGIILIAVSVIETKDKERINRVNEEQEYNIQYYPKHNQNDITSENISINDLYNGQNYGKNIE